MSAHVVKCDRTKPSPATADAACIAIDSKNLKYYLCKDQSKFSWLPLVEWLSQHLGVKCGLPIPDCAVIEAPSHPTQLLFGSRWESGGLDYSRIDLQHITNPHVFSSTLTFDCLIHNDDRHLNNYLYLNIAGDLVAKIMDHSRTWWHSGWPLPAPPPPASSKTVLAFQFWNGKIAWDTASSHQVLSAWRGTTLAEVTTIIDSAPPVWVNPLHRQQLLSWWGSPDWAARTDAVEKLFP